MSAFYDPYNWTDNTTRHFLFEDDILTDQDRLDYLLGLQTACFGKHDNGWGLYFLVARDMWCAPGSMFFSINFKWTQYTGYQPFNLDDLIEYKPGGVGP